MTKIRIDKIKDADDILIDFLDDVTYDQCKKCKNNENKYFCEKCNINICDNCRKICEEEKHNTLNLDEIKENYKKYIEIIKKILWSNVIPIKDDKIILSNEKSIKENEINIENIDNSIKENYLDKENVKDNYKDIFFIFEII